LTFNSRKENMNFLKQQSLLIILAFSIGTSQAMRPLEAVTYIGTGVAYGLVVPLIFSQLLPKNVTPVIKMTSPLLVMRAPLFLINATENPLRHTSFFQIFSQAAIAGALIREIYLCTKQLFTIAKLLTLSCGFYL
jgi:hypothetical protein